MSMESRVDRRIECALDVSYEFVKWNDDYLGSIEHPYHSSSVDLSISGICISFGKELNHHILQQLLSGTRKIRLGISLPGTAEPLIFFARVVWSSAGKSIEVNRERCGCVFVEPPEFKIYHLRKFISEQP